MNAMRILWLLVVLAGLFIFNEYILEAPVIPINDKHVKPMVHDLNMNHSKIKNARPAHPCLGTAGQYDRNPKNRTLKTLAGEVFTVDEVTLTNGLSKGLQVMIETDDELIPAYLGPKWLFESVGFEIRPADRVVVRGLRIRLDGFDIFFVAEIENKDKTLKIMDEDELCLWIGMGQNLWTNMIHVSNQESGVFRAASPRQGIR